MAEPKRRPADHDGLPMCSHLVCPKFVGTICTDLGCEPDAVCVPEAKAMVVEIRRMRPVYESAKAWRRGELPVDVEACEQLESSVDAAIADEEKERADG